MPPQLVAKTIQELRELTRKPINVNFFCHVQAKSDPDREHAWQVRLLPYYRELGIDYESPQSRLDIPPFGDAMCTVVEDAKPEVVSFHFGLPAPALLARVKAPGCRVMSSATTVEEALWLEAGGVDAIIAQGYEAGGHRGMFLATNLSNAIVSQPGTLPLVPQIVDAVRVPVIAAGGIADGRGIAAAFALGAAGTQLGTAYLLCPEAATPPLYRDALRQARGDATLMTNVFSGRPARILVNRLALGVGPVLDAPLDFPLPMGELQHLRAEAEQPREHRLHAVLVRSSRTDGKGDARQGADGQTGDGSIRATQATRRPLKVRPVSAYSHLASGLDRSRNHFVQ